MPHPPQGAASSKKRVGKISSPFVPPNFHPSPPPNACRQRRTSHIEASRIQTHSF
ncbi:hypothetical protein CGCSCA5_v004456 [Colletotrichum siamense]|nr:hypothetical protein CGCSCA5_v004456 [Colletotrichum siamense]KAF4874680.1 hypothetical protein CGCSCA1_v006191 [Colletotrichum siamense]